MSEKKVIYSSPTQSSKLPPEARLAKDGKAQSSDGVLYVVATPIGNLEDITLRALRVLKEVDFILCEDKRITLKLLNKYQIKTNLISFHKFNESKKLEEIISLFKSRKNIALVSDAGAPLISDPGSNLISTAWKNNIQIVSIPGPSALTTTLSVCPLNVSEFLFLGFLPSEKTKRNKTITSLKERSRTVVLFIAPHDLRKYLNEIYGVYPDIDVFYARELTKIYEEYWCGKIKDLLDLLENKTLKGEIVLGLNFGNITNDYALSKNEILYNMKSYITSGHSLKETSKIIAKKFNLSSKSLYDLYIRKGNS